MTVYVVELKSRGKSGTVISGVSSVIIDAPSKQAAREMASLFSGNDTADWANAKVRKVKKGSSFNGWRIAIQVIDPTSGPGVGPTVDILYTAGLESIHAAAEAVVTLLNATAPIDGAAFDSTTGVLTVSDATDALGDHLLRIGIFPPGTSATLAGGSGVIGVASLVLDFNDQGAPGADLDITFVSDGVEIPGIPDTCEEGANTGSGGAGDPTSDPDVPGGGGVGDPGGSGDPGDGTGGTGGLGGTGDTPDEPSTDDGSGGNGPDGNPDFPPVGLDPRQMPVSAPDLEGWFRADQLVGMLNGGLKVHAHGNMANRAGLLMDYQASLPATQAETIATLIPSAAAFNGQPAINMNADESSRGLQYSTTPAAGLFPNVLDVHVFMIMLEASHLLNSFWMDGSSDQSLGVRKFDATNIRMVNTTGDGFVNPLAVPPVGNAFVLEAYFNGAAESFLRINGGTKSTGFAAGRVNVNSMIFGDNAGGSIGCRIQVAEIIRFDGGELDNTDNALTDLYAYLADRYNIVIPAP